MEVKQYNVKNRTVDVHELFTGKNLGNKRIGKILLAIHGYFFYQIFLATPLFNKLANKCITPKDVVETSYNAFNNLPFKLFGWNLAVQQIQEEFLNFLQIIVKRQPSTILEIGTCGGGTLFALTKIANPNALIISLDLPKGSFGGGYYPYRIPYYKSFAKFNQKIKLVRADSHSERSLNKIKKILSKRQVDILFIDGDHSYKGVKRDFEMYSKLVKKGGLIAFHDILYDALGCEVNEFWKEIKNSYPHTEIIKNLNQKWAGIGLIFV